MNPDAGARVRLAHRAVTAGCRSSSVWATSRSLAASPARSAARRGAGGDHAAAGRAGGAAVPARVAPASAFIRPRAQPGPAHARQRRAGGAGRGAGGDAGRAGAGRTAGRDRLSFARGSASQALHAHPGAGAAPVPMAAAPIRHCVCRAAGARRGRRGGKPEARSAIMRVAERTDAPQCRHESPSLIIAALIAANLVGAVALIQAKHKARELARQLQVERVERDKLSTEWAQLQLEERLGQPDRRAGGPARTGHGPAAELRRARGASRGAPPHRNTQLPPPARVAPRFSAHSRCSRSCSPAAPRSPGARSGVSDQGGRQASPAYGLGSGRARRDRGSQRRAGAVGADRVRLGGAGCRARAREAAGAGPDSTCPPRTSVTGLRNTVGGSFCTCGVSCRRRTRAR